MREDAIGFEYVVADVIVEQKLQQIDALQRFVRPLHLRVKFVTEIVERQGCDVRFKASLIEGQRQLVDEPCDTSLTDARYDWFRMRH